MIQPFISGRAVQWTGRRVVMTTLGALAVGLGFWLVFRFYYVAFTLFAAVVLGTAIRPMVEWLYWRKVPRPVGVLLVYCGLLALLIGFMLLLAPLMVEQTRAIITKLPAYYQSLHAALAGSPSALVQRLALQLPAEPTLGLPAEGGGELPLGAIGQTLGYLGVLGRVAFIGTAILVLAFYWTVHGEHMVRTGMLRFSVDRRERWNDVIAEMETKVGAYMRGVSLLSLVVGVMATIAYLVIGLPSALVLGLLAGVFEAVPVIGPILGAVPAVLIALSVAPDKAVWVVLATIIIQQVEGQFLVPRVMDKAVGVSPIFTILAILAFSSLFGLAGAVLAIPLAALIQVLLNYVVSRHESASFTEPAGRDRLSALRYEAQELIQDVRSQMRHKPQSDSDEEGDEIEDLVEVAALHLDNALARAAEEQQIR